VKRLIVMGTFLLEFASDGKEKNSMKMIRKVFRIFKKNVLEDVEQETSYITSNNNVDWTIIRPTRLDLILNESKTKEYKHADWMKVSATDYIARADVAHFILEILKNNSYVHQLPLVTHA